MKNQEEFYNEWLESFTKTCGHMPTKKEIIDFKKEYKKLYIKNYHKNNDSKKSFVKITLSQKENIDFEKICDKYQKKKATLGRSIIIDFMNNQNTITQYTDDKLQEAIIQIRKIGNNINQLTKLAHTTNYQSYQGAFNNALSSLIKLEEDLYSSVIKKNDN